MNTSSSCCTYLTQLTSWSMLHLFSDLPLQKCRETLASCGISDGDVLQVLPAQQQRQQAPAAQQRQQQQQQPAAAPPSMAIGPDGSAVSPAAFIAAVKGDAALMGSLRMNRPKLAQMIMEDDVAGLQEELRMSHRWDA